MNGEISLFYKKLFMNQLNNDILFLQKLYRVSFQYFSNRLYADFQLFVCPGTGRQVCGVMFNIQWEALPY